MRTNGRETNNIFIGESEDQYKFPHNLKRSSKQPPQIPQVNKKGILHITKADKLRAYADDDPLSFSFAKTESEKEDAPSSPNIKGGILKPRASRVSQISIGSSDGKSPVHNSHMDSPSTQKKPKLHFNLDPDSPSMIPRKQSSMSAQNKKSRAFSSAVLTNIKTTRELKNDWKYKEWNDLIPELNLEPAPPRKQSSDSKGRRLSELIQDNFSEDSEDPLPETSPPKFEPPPESNDSWFKQFMNFLNVRYHRTFFLYYTRFFKKDLQEQCNNMDSVSRGWQMRYMIHFFEDTWNAEDLKRAKKDHPNDWEFYYEEYKREIDRPIHLMRILFKTIWYDFLWAVIFRILKQAAGITIPFIMANYLTSIGNYEKVDIYYSIGYCLLACLLTFWKELWGQHSFRYISLSRGRAIEEVRDNFFIKLLDTNIEFCNKANAAFLTKMLLYETAPLATYFLVLVSICAAPISITYAFVMIFIQFKSNPYVYFILAYTFLMLVLIAFMHRWMVILKKKYRGLGSRCAGFLEELTEKTKVVRVNSLQGFLVRRIWGMRKEIERVVRYLNILESLFDLIFSSPLLASSLILIGIQRSFYGDTVDSKILFTIISTLGSLKGVLGSLSDALSSYQDYKPAIALFNLFFLKVSRTPKISVQKIVCEPVKVEVPARESMAYSDLFSEHTPMKRKSSYHNIKAVDVPRKEYFIQFPKGVDRRTLEPPHPLNDDAVFFDKCTFVDKSNTMNEVLKTVFMEDYLGTATRIDKNEIKNMTIFSGISLRIPLGAKVCVMGLEASGRQSFMDCLSNEHELLDGRLIITGKVNHLNLSKASILNCSFRENITLDSPFNRKKFDKICSVLNFDINKLVGKEYGRIDNNPNITDLDKTKILLARTLYHNHDIVVFSNLFSALSYEDRLSCFDALMAQYLCFKTVIYNSNDRLIAQKSDLVLVFKDFTLVEQGRFKDLMKMPNSHIKSILFNSMAETKATSLLDTPLGMRKKRRRNAILGTTPEIRERILSFKREIFQSKFTDIVNIVMFFHRVIRAKISKRKEKELKYKSSMLLHRSLITSMIKFININGAWTKYFIFFIFLISCLLILLWDLWLGWWSNNYLKLTKMNFYFEMLIYLSFITGIYIVIRDLIYNMLTRRISSDIYFANIKKIVKANVRWFDIFTVPRIMYDMINYQNSMDDDFSKVLSIVLVDCIMIGISIIVSNIFFPGIFLLVTIAVFFYSKSIIHKFLEGNRILMVGFLVGKVDWFRAFVTGIKNTVSMRGIGKPRYLFKQFEEPALIIEANSTFVFSYAMRWLGIRTGGISAFLVFWVYLSPVIFNYWPIYDFKNNIWVLGLVLTWSGRASDYISDLMGNLLTLLLVCEGGERALELQKNYPTSQVSQFLVNLDDIADELDEAELEKIFQKGEESSLIPLPNNRYDKDARIIDFENVYVKSKHTETISGLTFSVKYGEKIALIQRTGSAVDSLLDIIMGFKTTQRPTNILSTQISSKYKIFDKDINSMSKFKLRTREHFLPENPPLFTGTLRDNVDPFSLSTDSDIIRVLHYLGFYTAYTGYIGMRRTEDVEVFLDKFTRYEQDRRDMCYRLIRKDYKDGIKRMGKDKYDMVLEEVLKAGKNRATEAEVLLTHPVEPAELQLFTQRDSFELDGVARKPPKSELYRSGMDHRIRIRRRFKQSVKILIALNELYLQAKRRSELRYEDIKLRKEISRRGFVDAADRVYFTSSMQKPEFRRSFSRSLSIEPEAHIEGEPNQLKQQEKESAALKLQHILREKGIIKTKQKSPLDTLRDYTISNPREREAMEKLLNSVFSNEGKRCSINMRRIIYLTRAILERPTLLIIEEDALSIENPTDPNYLDVVLAWFKDTTILCKMGSYKFLERFDRAATFVESKLVEFGPVQKLTDNPESQLHQQLLISDPRKITTQFDPKSPSLGSRIQDSGAFGRMTPSRGSPSMVTRAIIK
jgi:ABC-type multidrug transport system fused ATPase/permease subunit